MNSYDLSQLIHDIHAARIACESLHPERLGVKKYAEDLIEELRRCDKELKEAKEDEERKAKATELRAVA